jgi:hypothetical protein
MMRPGVDPNISLPNPDPSRYEILQHTPIEGWLLIWIKYLDCTNYEGCKILVYEDTTIDQLRRQRLIDPHFSENPEYRSPVARFEPTPHGWSMAHAFVWVMTDE